MAILVTHLIENLTDHSKILRRAENKHDLCRQGFGTTVMWHFCLYSDGKHYIIHKCRSLWQAIYQRKGSQQHGRGAQVFVPRRAHAGDLHELISLSNILCGKLINPCTTGSFPATPSQTREFAPQDLKVLSPCLKLVIFIRIFNFLQTPDFVAWTSNHKTVFRDKSESEGPYSNTS